MPPTIKIRKYQRKPAITISSHSTFHHIPQKNSNKNILSKQTSKKISSHVSNNFAFRKSTLHLFENSVFPLPKELSRVNCSHSQIHKKSHFHVKIRTDAVRENSKCSERNLSGKRGKITDWWFSSWQKHHQIFKTPNKTLTNNIVHEILCWRQQKKNTNEKKNNMKIMYNNIYF